MKLQEFKPIKRAQALAGHLWLLIPQRKSFVKHCGARFTNTTGVFIVQKRKTNIIINNNDITITIISCPETVSTSLGSEAAGMDNNIVVVRKVINSVFNHYCRWYLKNILHFSLIQCRDTFCIHYKLMAEEEEGTDTGCLQSWPDPRGEYLWNFEKKKRQQTTEVHFIQ